MLHPYAIPFDILYLISGNSFLIIGSLDDLQSFAKKENATPKKRTRAANCAGLKPKRRKIIQPESDEEDSGPVYFFFMNISKVFMKCEI